MRLQAGFLFFLFLAVLQGCGPVSGGSGENLASIQAFEAQVRGAGPGERMILARQYLDNLTGTDKEYLVPLLMSRLAASHPDDAYLPWYLYMAARSNERLGRLPEAVFAYRRIYHSAGDLIVSGASLRFLSMQRLLDLDPDPYLRRELHLQLLELYPDSIDKGLEWYWLAKTCESLGLFPESFEAYRKYLAFPDTVVPQKPNERQRVQELLMVAGTRRNWTRPDLDQLLREVRYALETKNADKLMSLQSRVNFFSMAWLQEKNDFNSQPNYSFRRFLETSKRINVAQELDSSSNFREAYLKTWGWYGYIPTWYLYFRRIDFPADPDTHGNWEWAGIYFGDSLQ